MQQFTRNPVKVIRSYCVTLVVLVCAAAFSEGLFHLLIGLLPWGEPWQSLVELLVMVTVFTSIFWYVVVPKALAEENKREQEAAHQQLLAATLEATDDGIVVVDKNLQIVAYNSKYLQIWGDVCSLVATRDVYHVFACIEEQVLDPEEFHQKSVNAYRNLDAVCMDIIRFKDGRVFERHTYPYTINGNTVGKVSSYRDITEKVRHDEQTRIMQAKLIHVNKMTSLGLLVSGIAHEVNNPNNYIMISSELMARSWKDCLPILDRQFAAEGEFMVGGVPYSALRLEVADLIDGITDGSRRIRDIVNSLKDFSRGSRGDFNALVDINQVITSATTMINHHIKRVTHKFSLQLTDPLPPLNGNQHQLEQVIINLVLNAVQSLDKPDAGITICSRYEQERGELVVEVVDQGCGISQENGEQVMEPFFTTRAEAGGTGLGLAICSTIVKEHHGMIGFTSTPGEGTNFMLRFPVAPNFEKGQES